MTIVVSSTWVLRSLRADVNSASVKLEEILQQWSRQTKAIRSARFKWDENQMIPKGGICDPENGALPIPDLPKDQCLPPEDHHSSGAGSLLLDGDLIRFEVTEEVYSLSKNRFVPRKYVSSFDGRTNKLLRESEGAAKEGSIFGKDDKQEKESLRLRALMLALRPADTEFSRIRIQSLELLPTPGSVRGRECIRLRVELPNGRQELYSVDPERDFCIVRYASELHGKLQSLVEVEYTQNDDLWIPTDWTIQVHRYPDGFVRRVFTGTVTDHAINEPVDEGAFEITFPDHSLMTDMRGGQPRTYVQNVGGHRAWLYILAAIVVVFCLLAAYRLWPHNTASQPDSQA